MSIGIIDQKDYVILYLKVKFNQMLKDRCYYFPHLESERNSVPKDKFKNSVATSLSRNSLPVTSLHHSKYFIFSRDKTNICVTIFQKLKFHLLLLYGVCYSYIHINMKYMQCCLKWFIIVLPIPLRINNKLNVSVCLSVRLHSSSSH